MAIIRPSHLIGAISGSIGSATFKQTAHGLVLSRRQPPARSPNARQLNARARFRRLTLDWRNLTLTQRTAWTAFARRLTNTDQLGLPRMPSGYQTFIGHNSPALTIGITPVQDPPSDTRLPQPTSTYLIFSTLSIPNVWAVTVWTDYDVYLILKASISYRFAPQPISFYTAPKELWPFKRWITIHTQIVLPGENLIWITVPFITAFGWPQVAQMFAFKATIWHQTALQSPALTMAGPVTDY